MDSKPHRRRNDLISMRNNSSGVRGGIEEIIADQILHVVIASPECTLEELTLQLRELHWSDIFFEVERLRKSGRIQLTQSSLGWTTTLRAA